MDTWIHRTAISNVYLPTLISLKSTKFTYIYMAIGKNSGPKCNEFVYKCPRKKCQKWSYLKGDTFFKNHDFLVSMLNFG